MIYDIIIIGAGPGGLTGAIYAKMANKSVLVLEKAYAGGQVASIYKIKNYPGFKEIDGYELAEKMRAQLVSLGAEFKMEEVTGVNLKDDIKTVTTHNATYKASAVIVATGAYARALDVKNEKEFLGRGISYCATCDGNFYKDKIVAVVGGGNTSMEDCLYLSNLAKKVYLIHRREVFTGAERSLNKIKTLASENKIEILTNCTVQSLLGNEKLEQIEILNKVTNKTQILNVDGLFVAIGRKPDTQIFEGQLTLNSYGYIVTDPLMRTNIKNVYAVGDVRTTPLKQIVTACADGAVAVNDLIKSM